MDVLTTFDFIDAFPEKKSLIVVGNAPTLENKSLGGWVDSHDVVVRFNDCRVKGYENDVGQRTDILVCNPYAETRKNRNLSNQIENAVVLVISPQTRRGDKNEFARWAGQNRVLFTYTPDIKIHTTNREKISLTTGTYGVSLLSNLLKPSALSITGFTMFQPGLDHHYWNSEVPNGLKAHSPSIEAGIFISVINAVKCPVILTPEIFDLSEKCSQPLMRHVTQKKW